MWSEVEAEVAPPHHAPIELKHHQPPTHAVAAAFDAPRRRQRPPTPKVTVQRCERKSVGRLAESNTMGSEIAAAAAVATAEALCTACGGWAKAPLRVSCDRHGFLIPELRRRPRFDAAFFISKGSDKPSAPVTIVVAGTSTAKAPIWFRF